MNEIDEQVRKGEVVMAQLTRDVIVREGQSKDSAKLGKLRAGDTVRVLSLHGHTDVWKSESAWQQVRAEVQLPKTFTRQKANDDPNSLMDNNTSEEQLVGWCNLFAKKKSWYGEVKGEFTQNLSVTTGQGESPL
jgi:hypothetical protein